MIFDYYDLSGKKNLRVFPHFHLYQNITSCVFLLHGKLKPYFIINHHQYIIDSICLNTFKLI